MTTMLTKREYRAARRADASGSGPTLEERPASRFPGATGAFALFGEVLLVGVLVTVAGLAVVTLPAALAAGIRHLRRYLNAEASPARLFWRDVRSALPGGLVVGTVALLIAGILTVDIVLANSGALPGGAAIGVIGWIGAVAGATLLLATAGAWSPESGWRGALREARAALAADLRGALYLAATAVFVGVAVWMLVPLILPALGCAALAVVAIPARRRTAR